MKELSYNQKQIFYNILGESNKKTLVFLHGFMENSSLWTSFASRFAKDFQVVIVNLPGHGASDCISEIHTMELMAEVVHLILEQENIKKVHLIGHSMGGYISLAFAENYPNNLESITLLNSSALPDSDEKQKNRNRTIEAAQRNKSIFIRTAIPNLFSNKNQQEQKEIIENAISHINKTSVCGIISATKGMKKRKDKTTLLKNLTIPKLYIIGEEDNLFQTSEIVAEAEQVKANFALLPSGHMSFLECPERTQEILENFIDNA